MEVKEWLGENNTLGIDIWNRKYRYNNESFDDWLDRVSGHDEYIKQLIIDKKFLFAGRILAGRGIANTEDCKRSLSNCYVIDPPDDNLESIFDTGKMIGRTYSYGGGTGTDISKLAPRGSKVRNSAKCSSGAVSFMDLYSLITGLICQEGRRGALMISMDVNHPDIEEFITVKSNPDKVTKANISVKISDEFMKAVKNDDMFELYFKREETGEEISRMVSARALFTLISQQAWDNAEPGVLFWDRITKYNLMQDDKEFKLAGVNPCGELPLPSGGACLLGSINLAAFVTEDKEFDFEEFQLVVFETVRALNIVLDEGQPLHPLEVQRDSAENWRAIGLGIMGLADMLIKMEIIYGSQESLELCDKIGHLMAQYAITQSIEEAENHGSFPKCDNCSIIASDFFKEHAHPTAGIKVLENGIRNAQLLSCAPTGTLSTMLNISGGIEPMFDRYYERKTETLNDEEKIYKVYTQIVWDYMQEHGISEDDDDQLPEWFITAKEIPYQDRIKMQGVWQKHIDNSISSTVNLPESTTIKDVMDLYMMAWEEGLKGVTIFREGCKRAPILNSTKKKEKPKNDELDVKKYEFTGSTIKDFMEDIIINTFAGIAKENIEKGRFIEYSDKIMSGKEEVNLINMLDSWNESYGEDLSTPKTEPHALPMIKSNDGIEPLPPISKEGNTLERGEVIKAPANSIGKKKDLVTGCGSLHFQAFFDMNTGDVVETYLSKGSEGGCNSFMIGLSRMISMAGRAGVSVYEIADQLRSAPGCPSYITRKRTKKDVSKGICCPAAVGNALVELYEIVQKEISFGGVYYGSPLYHKLKMERDGRKIVDVKSHPVGELPIIPDQTSKLADTLLSIPGVGEAMSRLTDGELMKALDRIYRATFDQNMEVTNKCSETGNHYAVNIPDVGKVFTRITSDNYTKGKNTLCKTSRKMDCSMCEKECMMDQIRPVSKEEFDTAVKDLANKVDTDVRDWLEENNVQNEKNARIIDSLKNHPGMIELLAQRIREGDLTNMEDFLSEAERGIQPVGLRSDSPFFADIKEDLQSKYAEDTGLCPQCGNPLSFEGGCNTCKACGWSRCD